MKISKYDIVLRTLSKNDLELVREKRNSDSVRNFMLYKKIISPEEQIIWYESLNPASDLYFMIENDSIPCGLINVRNIDYLNARSESGLFIWEEKFLKSHVPVVASWLMSEAGYGILGGPQTQIRVLKNNTTAIDFNRDMGFTITHEENEIVFMQQSKESFSKATLKQRQRFLQGKNADPAIVFSFNDHENDDLYLEWFLSLTEKNSKLRKRYNERQYSFEIIF